MDIIEYLKGRVDDDAADRDLLMELVEPHLYPKQLGKFVGLGMLYDAAERQLQLPRTPNKFPSGAIANAGINTVTSIRPAVDGLQGNGELARDLSPRDGYRWRVLGGIVSINAGGIIQLRQEGGKNPFFYGQVAVSTPIPFTIPGNGLLLDEGKTIEWWASVNVTLGFQFYVSEEKVQPRQNVTRRTGGMSGREPSPPGSMEIP